MRLQLRDSDEDGEDDVSATEERDDEPDTLDDIIEMYAQS